MPPKPVKQKEKEKVVDDKTFGMKNKNKSTKVKQFIEGMKASSRTQPVKTKEQQESEHKTKKVEAEKAALLASIFGVAPVKKKKKEVKVDDGKIDLYTDQRAQGAALPEGETEETMTNWDQSKLEEVVKSKHATQDANKTDIVCKFFLEAVQKSLYGWFWSCPNGETCKYRHALPPGYILKKPEALDADSDEEGVPLEEQLEAERQRLPPGGTPVTEETFMAWLKKKSDERIKMLEDEAAAKGKKRDVNRNMMSGKQLFVMDPTLFVDDDGAASDYEISDHEGQEEEEEEHQEEEYQDDDDDESSNDDQQNESEDEEEEDSEVEEDL